jgi:Tfp pilus assembly major pilin PilA
MIELMVVVVIVGVLAAIAIPLYGKYIKNSRVTEATSKIGDIITAAKSHAVANSDASGNPMWPTGSSGIVDLGNTQLFSYAITSGGGANGSTTPLVLTATGLAGGKMAGVTIVVTIPNVNSSGNAPVVSGL